VDELLRQGIAAAQAGQSERAREFLMRVLHQDEGNVQAWLWLSGVVDSLDDREICLENVLALDPTHELARQGLARVRQQKEAGVPATGQVPDPLQERPAAVSTSGRKPASLAAAVLRQDLAQHLPPPEPEPEAPPIPLEDEFDSPYGCPYCAAQTEPGHRRCAACGNRLWVRSRRRAERSPWLWMALTLQSASTIWPTTLLLLMLTYAAYQAGIDSFHRLVPLYLGLPSEIPPVVADEVLEAVPRAYVWPLALFSLFSLMVLVGLYLRWKPVFYLFLMGTLLLFGLATLGMAFGLSLPSEGIVINQKVGALCGAGGLVVALLLFLLVLRIADDFGFDERRLLLRPDRDATNNGPALLSSGRSYARRQMWAMVVIHLRRAVAMMPHAIEPHMGLGVAYLKLKRYDLAARALAEARQIDPGHPQVEQLTTMLVGQVAAESHLPDNISL